MNRLKLDAANLWFLIFEQESPNLSLPVSDAVFMVTRRQESKVN